ARRLAGRRISPHSPDHRPSSTSSPTDSSLVHSSGLDAPDQTHSRSSTRVVSPRLGYLPVRAPRHSEAFRHWEEFEANARDTVVLGINLRSVPIVDEEIVKPVGGDSSYSSDTRDGIVRSFEDMPIDLDDVPVERAGMAERIESLRSKNLKVRVLWCIERDHVDSLRLHMSRSQEEFRQIRDDRDDLRRKLRRTMSNTRSGMTPTAIEEMINR
nr:hypothetical protein [Tanacetum cinerariifolium]